MSQVLYFSTCLTYCLKYNFRLVKYFEGIHYMFRSSNNSRLLGQYISSSEPARKWIITIFCISSCYCNFSFIFSANIIVIRFLIFITIITFIFFLTHILFEVVTQFLFQRSSSSSAIDFVSLLHVASASESLSASSEAISSCLRDSCIHPHHVCTLKTNLNQTCIFIPTDDFLRFSSVIAFQV